MAKVVRLRKGDGGITLVLARGVAERKPVRNLDELHSKRRKAQTHARANPGVRALHLGTLSTGAKADYELAGNVLGRGRCKRQVGLKTSGGTGPARAGGCRSGDEQSCEQEENGVLHGDPFPDDNCQPDSGALTSHAPKRGWAEGSTAKRKHLRP